MPGDVTGLILAGGQSRRFGSDKALASIDGQPMIARVYAALAPLCVEVLVAVDHLERRYALPGPARFVVDEHPDAGPLAGLQAGLAAAHTPCVLALACDLPFLATDMLRHLLTAPEADAVVAQTPDGRQQPLCARYHRRILPIVEDHLATRRLALHALLDQVTVQSLPLPAKILHNVNTPRDGLFDAPDALGWTFGRDATIL